MLTIMAWGLALMAFTAFVLVIDSMVMITRKLVKWITRKQ